MLILGIAGLGAATLRSARLFLVEQALCRAYYAVRAPRLVRPDGGVDEHLCKADALQADVALVSGVFEVFSLVCGMRNDPSPQTLSSRHMLGRVHHSHRPHLLSSTAPPQILHAF